MENIEPNYGFFKTNGALVPLGSFLTPKNIQLPIQVISIQFKISYIQIILTLIENH